MLANNKFHTEIDGCFGSFIGPAMKTRDARVQRLVQGEPDDFDISLTHACTHAQPQHARGMSKGTRMMSTYILTYKPGSAYICTPYKNDFTA